MQQDVRFIVMLVWFGPFRSNFNLWLDSALRQKFHVAVVTDQLPECRSPLVKYYHTTFNELKQHIDRVMGFEVKLDRPYKLCDFKPAYGEIFAHIVEGYEYWGYCDLDIIFGSCDILVDEICRLKPDKVFERGHLSFYRNTPEINAMYRNGTIDHRKVFTNSKNCLFDEWKGIGRIMKQHGKHVLHKEWMIDINPNSLRFKPVNIPSYAGEKFIYDGDMKHVYQLNNQLHVDKYCYIHFQKRSIDFSEYASPFSPYLITSRKLVRLQNGTGSHEGDTMRDINLAHFCKRFAQRSLTRIGIRANDVDHYLTTQ